jgi:hypothetical protein
MWSRENALHFFGTVRRLLWVFYFALLPFLMTNYDLVTVAWMIQCVVGGGVWSSKEMPLILGGGHFFVIGDILPNSFDSCRRFFPRVPKKIRTVYPSVGLVHVWVGRLVDFFEI